MNPIKLACADELQHSAMLQSPRTCQLPTLHTALKTGLSEADEKEKVFFVL
jgi:hypothetical protein